jgi:hypothetical protein
MIYVEKVAHMGNDYNILAKYLNGRDHLADTEDNVEVDLKYDVRVFIGFILLRTVTSGRL